MDNNLEIRSMDIRSVDTETRTITGLAVPYGQTTNVGGYKERFEKGAFGDARDVKLFYGHSEPIGLVTKGEDTDEGYMIEARISETERGNEVYTLMKDGVLNRFSVGFLPVEHRMEEDVVVRTRADLKEISVVAFPAYEGAKVSEVREASEEINEKEGINMSNEINTEVADLRMSVEDLERRFAVMSEGVNTGQSKVEYRSAGEWLKALAAGEQEARDFATTVEADVTRPGWVAERLRLVNENRPTINLFSKGVLPASGNSIEYPYVSGTSGTVSEQTAEGDDLPYMEVALDTATAPVKTYGGYISLSRQAIERSDMAYLETATEYMVRQYAKATEKAVRDAMVNASGTGTDSVTAATAKAADWLEVVADASAYIEENAFGASADVAVVSADVWKAIALLTDVDDRPVFNVYGAGVNNVGAANVTNGALNVGGLTVVRNSALATGSMFIANRDAIKTFESSGSPFRLQDENIINLTRDFSLYGHLAVAVLNAKAIVKVTVS